MQIRPFKSDRAYVDTVDYDTLDNTAKVAVLLATHGHDVRVENKEGEAVCFVIEYERYNRLTQR